MHHRPIQRGIGVIFIIVLILALAVAATSAYFIFSQTLTQKSKAINSFEDCAKLYPVMESYPEQCAIPDGKHFTRKLSEEEKQTLVPPTEPSPPVSTTETASWKTYSNPEVGFQINYPQNMTSCLEKEFILEEGESESVCSDGEGPAFLSITDRLTGMGDVEKTNYPDCYSLNKKTVQIAGIEAAQYTASIIKDTDECTMPSAYARKSISTVLKWKGKTILIRDPLDDYKQELKKQILNTLKFL